MTSTPSPTTRLSAPTTLPTPSAHKASVIGFARAQTNASNNCVNASIPVTADISAGTDTATTRGRLARLNANGTLDPAFNPNANQAVRVLAVQANGTYGSDNTIRGFVRLNAGSADGIRGFVSYGYGSTDKYKGTGQQDQHMVNAKVVLPIGDATLDAWFSYSDRREQD